MRSKPSQLLLDYAYLLTREPLTGPVLDLACGNGRNGVFLAQKNLSVICCDSSQEALDKARKLATDSNATVKLWHIDLEQKGVNPLSEDRYGGILVFQYLHRPLIPCIKKALKGGGIGIYETFTNEQPKFGKPHNPDFLLRPGELFEWFRGWEVLYYFEGTKEKPRRALAQIVYRKPI